MLTNRNQLSKQPVHPSSPGLPGSASARPLNLSAQQIIASHRQLAEISARMMRATSTELDDLILLSLRQALEPLGVDRGGLLHVLPDTPIVRISHGWYAEGIPQISGDINLAELFPWSYQRLVVQGQAKVIAKLDDYPPEAVVDRRSHGLMGTKSVLTLPLFVGRRIHHLIAVHTVKNACEWPDEVINQVRILGEIIVSALQRREAEAAMLQARNRLEVAATAADAGLWELDRATGQFWITDKAREILGFEKDAVVTVERFLEKVHPDDRPVLFAAFRQLSGFSQPLDLEFRLPGPGEGVRWLRSRGRLQQCIGNECRTLTGVTIEVTWQKDLEQQLRENLREIDQLRAKLEQENSYLRSEGVRNEQRQDLLGASCSMQAIMAQIQQVAGTGSTVLIQGETGTGKELIAQTIHQLSERGKRAMIKVNCAALPAALVESELFGREKGAFTGALTRQAGRFELADDSTLFLDEIGEMPIETQAKLLRVLQEGEFERLGSPRIIKVNVRVIAASNRDLAKAVEEGRFRRDLYYRLNIFPIQVPPLRERPEDIPQLVWKFVSEVGELMGKKIRRIAIRDMEMLQAYAWPGNVRELRNVIEHALIVSKSETLELHRLAPDSPAEENPGTLEEVERRHIQSVLKTTHGRIKGAGGAAERLGINPSTLYSRMRKLGISAPAR